MDVVINSPIDVLVNGVPCVNIAEAIASHFDDRGWIQNALQERWQALFDEKENALAEIATLRADLETCLASQNP